MPNIRIPRPISIIINPIATIESMNSFTAASDEIDNIIKMNPNSKPKRLSALPLGFFTGEILEVIMIIIPIVRIQSSAAVMPVIISSAQSTTQMPKEMNTPPYAP